MPSNRPRGVTGFQWSKATPSLLLKFQDTTVGTLTASAVTWALASTYTLAQTFTAGVKIGPTGAGVFSLGTAEAVTIATGVATVTRPLVDLAGEGATTDTLDSIVKSGQTAGELLLIQCSGAYTITFDNSSTLILGAGTRAMAAGSTMLLLATSATVWREVTFLTAAS